MKITVYFDPKDVKTSVAQNATVVLADVLRVSTTIPVYLYHGAKGVVLCQDPGSAKKQFEKLKRGEGLLAGERDWEKIPGFHMGGSPLESTRDKVKNRIVCMSSFTPLRLLQEAKHLVLGSFVNLTDVYDSCLRAKRDVVIVCAGGPEDSAFAGMLVDFLQSTLGGTPVVLAKSAKDTISLYKPWQGRLWELLNSTPDGKGLTLKGFAKDLDFCSRLNRISAVPLFQGNFFIKEDAPKPKKTMEADGKPKPTSASPKKGKSIKVMVPLFPKNPEHPVPGIDKAGGKKGQNPADAKKKDQAFSKKAPLKTIENNQKAKKANGKSVPLFTKKSTATTAKKISAKPVIKTHGKKK